MYKILLIEPELQMANKIRNWLQKHATVVHISDEINAQKQAALAHWDLVITDVNSCDINNLDITKIVKKIDSTTAILIIAENIKVDFILTAMKYRADGLFFKPLDKETFVSRALQLAEESKFKKEKAKKVVLAIGAHPDDVEIGCGGTLAKLLEEGNEVNILTLSSGAVGGSPEVRRREAKKAAKLQGAKLFLGDFVDTKITSNIETIQFIESIVQEINPTWVYTHSFNDNHQDHRAVYQATVTACRPVLNVYSYLSPSSTIDFRPNIFINIDDYIDKKLKVLAVYKSQSEMRPYLATDMIVATARYWGRFCSYNMVEPMEVVKGQS